MRAGEGVLPDRATEHDIHLELALCLAYSEWGGVLRNSACSALRHVRGVGGIELLCIPSRQHGRV